MKKLCNCEECKRKYYSNPRFPQILFHRLREEDALLEEDEEALREKINKMGLFAREICLNCLKKAVLMLA